METQMIQMMTYIQAHEEASRLAFEAHIDVFKSNLDCDNVSELAHQASLNAFNSFIKEYFETYGLFGKKLDYIYYPKI